MTQQDHAAAVPDWIGSFKAQCSYYIYGRCDTVGCHRQNGCDMARAIFDYQQRACMADAALVAEQALRDIIDPIGKIKREMPAGYVLDGQVAVYLANNVDYLQSLALAALAAIERARNGGKP